MLFLYGCNGGTFFYYNEAPDTENVKLKKVFYRGNISKLVFIEKDFTYEQAYNLFTSKTQNVNTQYKTCFYMLSYFLPINFWNAKSPEYYANLMLSNNLKNNIKLTDVTVQTNWFGSPIISYSCNIIKAKFVV
jgi:hypothetical protein